ncbi:MAG: tryptophan synthase subunit alpha [Halobacteriaceae archaeon]
MTDGAAPDASAVEDAPAATRRDLAAAFAGEPALVAYLTAGDPDFDATADYVEALVRGGADVVELGLPFSEPIADGPTIQDAIVRALEGGATPEAYFALVERLRAERGVEVPLVCMTYYNLVYQYGDEPVTDFVARAAGAGLSGLVVPDLPVEESEPLRAACADHGLDLVFIVAPTTTDERLERILSVASGFVYVQARMGTTGARADVSDETYESLARLPETDVPRAVGFGISEGEQARAVVAGGADGVVAGSVFVDAVAEAGDDTAAGAERLAAIARELKRGTIDGLTEHGRSPTDN